MKRSLLKPVSSTLMLVGVLFLGTANAYAQSSSIIQYQADDMARQAERRADRLIQRETKEYNSEIKDTQRSAVNSAAQLSTWDGWGEKQMIMDQAKAREEYLKQLEEKSTQEDIQSMKRRAQSLNDSAKNLQGLINQKPSSSGVQVNPTGTNLFVRNYR